MFEGSLKVKGKPPEKSVGPHAGIAETGRLVIDMRRIFLKKTHKTPNYALEYRMVCLVFQLPQASLQELQARLKEVAKGGSGRLVQR